MSFQCPSCDKSLRNNAKSCECGWEKTPSPKESSILSSSLDHQCTYNDHGARCRYPVSFFEPGQTRSFCRYHKRYFGDVEMCAKILARSHRDTEAEYVERSNHETYGEGRTKMEQEIFDRLWKTQDAQRAAEKVAA